VSDNVILMKSAIHHSNPTPAESTSQPAAGSAISLTRWQFRRLEEAWWGIEPALELVRTGEVDDSRAIYYMLRPFIRELGEVVMEIDDSLEERDG